MFIYVVITVSRVSFRLNLPDLLLFDLAPKQTPVVQIVKKSKQRPLSLLVGPISSAARKFNTVKSSF